jgi:hypothetical protein
MNEVAAHRVPIEEMLTIACRAPSVENTQPWLWRWDGSELVLLADFSRQLVQADPAGRDLVISCGAALHHLQVTALAMAWQPVVQRIPHADGRTLASIRFEPTQVGLREHRLMLAIEGRATDRRAMNSWPVPSARLETLCREGQQWGVQVRAMRHEADRKRLVRIVVEADRRQQEDARYRLEQGGGGTVDTAVRLGQRPAPSEHVGSEAMLLFSTASDDLLSWLRTGEALSAVWLHAAASGLSLVPLSQGIEVDETRALLEESVLEGRACPQLLARVGWLDPAAEPSAPTTRRPLAEVLISHHEHW